MRPVDLRRPDLVMLLGALGLTIEVMQSHLAKHPEDGSYGEWIKKHQDLCRRLEQLVAYGDALESSDAPLQTDFAEK